MSYRRKFAVLTATLLTGLGIVVAPTPATAAPAATCYAASCNAKDPEAEGCSAGARTLQRVDSAGYHLELRYSGVCHAAWVRVDSDGYWSQTGTFRLERETPSSYFSGSFGPGETGRKWTRMYSYQNYQLRGRLMVVNHSTGWKSDDATDWH
jgi:Protein of unknown function (DUF2690)